MRTIIADDEHLSRSKLRILLESEPDVQITAECRNGAETVAAVATRRPDLLFLDIRMPDMDGFEVLGRLGPDVMPVVIFTTAYDQYAVRAFEADALDYLLKPFDAGRLRQAVKRARAELLVTGDRKATYRMLDSLANARTRSDNVMQRRLVIKSGGRITFLQFDEIDWLEAAGNYVKLNVGKQSYLMREGIGRIAEKLDPAQFVRIHRSIIVNVRKIKEMQPVNSGEFIVSLDNGKQLSCSRGYRNGLTRLIETNS